jgi:hypothetical protein
MSQKRNTELRDELLQAEIDKYWRLLPQYEAELRALESDPALVPNRLKGAAVNSEGDAI